MGEDARLRAVVELAQAMAAAGDLAGAVRVVAETARRALDGAFAAVSVWERERGRLRVLVNNGELAPGEVEFPVDESYPVHDFPEIAGFSPAGWTAGVEPRAWIETADEAGGAAGAPVEAAAAAHRRSRAAALRRRGRGSCVVAPVVLHGRAWGELYVARGVDAVPLGLPEAAFATVLAEVAASGLVHHERLAEVRKLAYTDPLTGLANRRAVDALLEDAVGDHRRDGTAVSLVVCDVNGLKGVNDSLGHVAGDHLLERFASVLSLCGAQLPGSLAARLGGDEFCLVAVGSTAPEVIRVAREICRRADGLELGQGVACGVASTGRSIGPVVSARRLFRLADAAQYRAKAADAREPVVAGDEGADDPVVLLADSVRGDDSDRRAFRDRPAAAGRPGGRRGASGGATPPARPGRTGPPAAPDGPAPGGAVGPAAPPG
ncbi:diguanylate cyclase domain-containing protein, partial [Streptomyces lonarensis]